MSTTTRKVLTFVDCQQGDHKGCPFHCSKGLRCCVCDCACHFGPIDGITAEDESKWPEGDSITGWPDHYIINGDTTTCGCPEHGGWWHDDRRVGTT